MYDGKPTQGLEFYNLLLKSEKFTSELGKVTLASGKLETELIIFLKRNGIERNYKRATLGTLIDIAEKRNLLDKNIIFALKIVLNQRNYITHNIYALFTDQIDETILEKNNLLDSDILLYEERAWQLKDNIDGVADIIKDYNNNEYE